MTYMKQFKILAIMLACTPCACEKNVGIPGVPAEEFVFFNYNEIQNFYLDSFSIGSSEQSYKLYLKPLVITKENFLLEISGWYSQGHHAKDVEMSDTIISELKPQLENDKIVYYGITFGIGIPLVELYEKATIICDHTLFGVPAGYDISEHFVIYSTSVQGDSYPLIMDYETYELEDHMTNYISSFIPFNDFFIVHNFLPDINHIQLAFASIPEEDCSSKMTFKVSLPISNGKESKVITGSCTVKFGEVYKTRAHRDGSYYNPRFDMDPGFTEWR